MTITSDEAGDDMLAGWHLHLDRLRYVLDGNDPSGRGEVFVPLLALYAGMH